MESCGKLPLSGTGEKQRGHSTAETELAALVSRADNQCIFCVPLNHSGCAENNVCLKQLLDSCGLNL